MEVTTQLANRINSTTESLKRRSQAFKLSGYERFFAGSSRNWNSGGIASIRKKTGSFITGFVINLSHDEKNIFTQLMESARYCTLGEISQALYEVARDNSNQKIYVYIKRNKKWIRKPSNLYLKAIAKTVRDQRNLYNSPYVGREIKIDIKDMSGRNR